MRKIKIFIIFALLIISSVPTAWASGCTFEPHTFYGKEKIDYYLFTPQNATENMPLIVYLHGGSGKGDNIEKLTENGFCMWVKEGKFDGTPAYILFPQLSSKYKGWSDAKNLLKELINNVTDTYAINPNRISLTGHSMGGTGTFAVASAYPGMFSCVVPMSGSIQLTDENLDAFSSLPVWAFVGSVDTIVSPSFSEEFVAALKENGCDARLTVFEGADHFSVPELAYLNENLDVVGYLTSHSKSNKITDCTDGTVSITAQLPGEYSLITARRTQGGTEQIKLTHVTVAYGKNTIPISDFDIQNGDEIMLWKDLKPIAKKYTVGQATGRKGE